MRLIVNTKTHLHLLLRHEHRVSTRFVSIGVNLWFKSAKLADKNGQHDVLSLRKKNV